MDDRKFSFVELDARIRNMPDGPAKTLDTPRWITALNVVGCLGILVGLTPSLLIHWFDPHIWMVWMAKGGLWVALLFVTPGIVRAVVVVARSMFRWQAEQVEQMDHDLVQMRELRRWLAQFPSGTGAEALRFVRHCQTRMSAKLGFIGGSLEKLGILPVLIAAVIQLKALEQWRSIPMWQVVFAIFLAITYLVALVGTLMRLRLQLYELVLADSLVARGVVES